MDHTRGDLDWLGLSTSSDGAAGRLVVANGQINPTGRLYGGVAVACAIVMMEAYTGQPVRWTTVQFSSSCGAGETVDLAVVVSARGRRTSQLRVVARVDGREMFTALGAVAVDPASLGSGPGSMGQWETMPTVASPQDCPPLSGPLNADSNETDSNESNLGHSDVRLALGFDVEPAAQLAVWCRPHNVARLSAAVLGWQADILGLAFVKTSGTVGGTSLDNTIRFGPSPDPGIEWILLDVRVQAVYDGYGHAQVLLWAPDATLLAVGSQTCIVRKPS